MEQTSVLRSHAAALEAARLNAAPAWIPAPRPRPRGFPRGQTTTDACRLTSAGCVCGTMTAALASPSVALRRCTPEELDHELHRIRPCPRDPGFARLPDPRSGGVHGGWIDGPRGRALRGFDRGARSLRT